MITQNEDLRECFDSKMLQWSYAVIKYAKTTQVRSSALQQRVLGFHDDMDGGKGHCNPNVIFRLLFSTAACAMLALRSLFLLFATNKDKKGFNHSDDIPFLLKVNPVRVQELMYTLFILSMKSCTACVQSFMHLLILFL